MLFRNSVLNIFAPALILAAASAQAAPAEYKIDQGHSEVGFSVTHLMISTVRGKFKEFDGSFMFDPDKGTVSDANFTVKTKSVDTNEPKRDEHLRGADFFDVEKFPEMTLKNSKITKAGKNKYKWVGDLTIRGVTKPVTLNLDYKGSMKDPWGNQKAGFAATGKINRKDYGLTWNKALEAGGVTVGDEVTINLDIEAQQQQAAAPAGATPAADTKKKK